jgi:hypothetical protein
MMIEQGYRAIAVFMDVWGISAVVSGSLAQSRQYAAEAAPTTNGKASVPNGAVVEEGKTPEVVVNRHR